MGPRSDFSKPCQGAVEKSANATRQALHSAASKATVRLCLARGSQSVGMSNKRTTVYPGEMELAKNPRHTFVCRGFFLCNRRGFEQQQRRPQPAAETGRSCWGRVLIFQSPAKGLQKNQQTQPVRPCAAGQAISPAGCCLVRGSQPVGISNKRTTVYPGEMELALFVFHPDAVQSVCDKGLPV